MSNREIPLLVVSCDKYSDLWEPFFSVFWKRWPDCPYAVYLGSNQKTFGHDRVKPIIIGEDVTWSSNVLKMLDILNSSHVIIMLDDFLVQQPVNTQHVEHLVSTAIRRNVDCLRLGDANLHRNPQGVQNDYSKDVSLCAPSESVPDETGIGIIVGGTPYRVSTQISLWKVETLRKYLLPGFNAWQFEEIGSQLSDLNNDQFWSVWEPVIVYDHGVEKGKWKPEGLLICSEAGVEVDLSLRGVFDEKELRVHYLASRRGRELYEIKSSAIEKFLKGCRLEALRSALNYAIKMPSDVGIWGVIIFGLLGRNPLLWLKRRYILMKSVRYGKQVR